MQLSQQCIWNSLFGGCVGIPLEFREVWHQTNSTRTWRPWSVTPKALSCLTLWSSVHQWRRCGRSLVANRWDLVEVEGGCLGWLGLVDYFTQKIDEVSQFSRFHRIQWLWFLWLRRCWFLAPARRTLECSVRLASCPPSSRPSMGFGRIVIRLPRCGTKKSQSFTFMFTLLLDWESPAKVMVQHLPCTMHGATKSQICCLFCAVPGALEHQLWKQRTQHPPKTTESILRGAKIWQVWFRCWHLQERTCQECEISRMIEGYGGILSVLTWVHVIFGSQPSP